MPGPYLNTGLFDSKVTDNHTVGPKTELGVWRFEAGKILRYVKSAHAIDKNAAVKMDATVTTAALIGHQVGMTSAATDLLFGVAETTFAALSFGWVTVSGVATARVDSLAAAGQPLGPHQGNTGMLSFRSYSHFHAGAVALAAGLSGGSAVHINAL